MLQQRNLTDDLEQFAAMPGSALWEMRQHRAVRATEEPSMHSLLRLLPCYDQGRFIRVDAEASTESNEKHGASQLNIQARHDLARKHMLCISVSSGELCLMIFGNVIDAPLHHPKPSQTRMFSIS
jgi:hypothetical protein